MKTVLGVCGALAFACAGVAEARAGASFADEVTLPREKPASELFKDVPAPTNLPVPPYRFVSDTRILIGAEAENA